MTSIEKVILMKRYNKLWRLDLGPAHGTLNYINAIWKPQTMVFIAKKMNEKTSQQKILNLINILPLYLIILPPTKQGIPLCAHSEENHNEDEGRIQPDRKSVYLQCAASTHTA